MPATAVSEYGTYHTLLGRLRIAKRPRGQPVDPAQRTVPLGRDHAGATARARLKPAPLRWNPLVPDLVLGNGCRPHRSRSIRQDSTSLCPGYPAPSWEKQRFAKRNKYRAAARMRIRISNLIDELHHQTARWLVGHHPATGIRTSEMVLRGARAPRKSVRSMLSYRFQRFLAWKCWQRGGTRHTPARRVPGEIIPNLGGAKVVRGSDGVVVERDENGARIPAGFGRYPSPARSCAGAHRRLRYRHC